MEPGDTVFWHADVVQAVENEHKGSGYSNVMYIASTPVAPRILNTWLSRRLPSSVAALPPDFAADDFEVDFKGRSTAGVLLLDFPCPECDGKTSSGCCLSNIRLGAGDASGAITRVCAVPCCEPAKHAKARTKRRRE